MSKKSNVYEAVSAMLLSMHVGKVRKVTKYFAPDLVVKATLLHRPDGRTKQVTAVVTTGRPNYVERKFIKACLKAGEPFPIAKPQLKLFKPKKAA